MKKITLVFLLFLTVVPAAIASTTNINVTKVAPRVFSPEENATGVNRVRFFLDNPDNTEISVRIFDLTGSMVRGNVGLESETGDEMVMYWDGRDQDGNVVRSGIYIYQIEADNTIINGTVVVAR